ncbi:MAG: GNAT family N-acetyltransferase [Actinomycetota bacterium]
MIDVVVEDLTAATRDEVRALILDGLAEHWGAIDESLNPDLDDLLAYYRDGRTIVARDRRGEIVGTGTVVPRRRATAEVVRMSVRAEARGSGVGRRLVDELVATARRWGCDTVVLETTSTWTDVVAFYRRCGFVVTHVEEGALGSDTWFALDLRPTT